jgi:hypothetical protein
VINPVKKTVALVVLASLLTSAACGKSNTTSRDTNAGAPVTTASPPASPPASDPAGAPGDSLPPAAIVAAIKTQAAAFATLTPNEKKWGVSPTRNDKVTYAPGVIIMEHGSDAIRGMESNGMRWTIDANAPHADEIKVDRILFATGRVVGRVLAVERKGSNLSVTLGPVELTEVITEANLSSDQQLDPSLMLTYTAPDYPGATSRDEPDSSASASLGPPEVPVMFASYQPPFQGLPVIGAGAQLVLDGYMVAPVALPNLGMTLVHDGPSVKMMATAALDLHSPWVHFELVIHGATIYTAIVEMHGAAGFRVRFSAGTEGLNGNLRKDFLIPIDNSFPIVGLGVPLSVTFRQTLTLTTLFTGKSGTLEANGEYLFTGTFEGGKRNGGDWHASGPSSVTIKSSLVDGLSGMSLAVNGLTFGYGAKVIVGIGAWGFITGPYAGYNTIIGVNKSSDIPGGLPCRSGQVATLLRYGVGYQMPESITRVINFFFHALNIKQIRSEGGFEKLQTLSDTTDYVPEGCRPKSAA